MHETTDARSQLEKEAGRRLVFCRPSEFQQLGRRASVLMDRYNRSSVEDDELQREILSELLGQVAEGVVIRPSFLPRSRSGVRRLREFTRCAVLRKLPTRQSATLDIQSRRKHAVCLRLRSSRDGPIVLARLSREELRWIVEIDVPYCSRAF